MDHSDIKTLVCETCWRGFFSTDDFWGACKPEPTRTGHEYTATHRAFNVGTASPTDKCNWCAFIKTTTPWASRELVCDVSFSQAHDSIYKPVGRNHWRVQLDRHSFQVLAFTDADDKAAAYVTARPIQTNVNTQAAIDQVNTWLESCQSHAKCTLQHRVPLPTRVIEVSPQESPTRPRLFSTNNTSGRYVAMSYCWGGSQPGSLTKHNIVQYSTALSLHDLSQTVQDAIEVTRKVDRSGRRGRYTR